MSWLAPLLELLNRFFKWRDDEAKRAEGRNLERREVAASVQEKVHVAEEVRKDVIELSVAQPERVRDDDGFKRKPRTPS